MTLPTHDDLQPIKAQILNRRADRPTSLDSPVTHDDLARAICCPSGVCQSPERCDVEDRSRSHLVDIHRAANAVGRLLCERWREFHEADRSET